MNTAQLQDLPMHPSSFEDRCEVYFISEYKRRVDGFLSDNFDPHYLPDGVDDEILSYLLDDTALFLTQKTEHGTFSPWCFDERQNKEWKTTPHFQCTFLYDRLWEAFRIYPEEWNTMLHTICFDGHLTNQFSIWQAQHFFSQIAFQDLIDVFALGRNNFDIGLVLRNAEQRLLELQRHLISAGLQCVWETTKDDFTSPFTTGLQQYVQRKSNHLIPIFLRHSLNLLTPLPPIAVPATLDTNPEFDKTTTTILFSTAGTGKTRSLLDLLNKKFGMYIVAPGVPKRPSGSENIASEKSNLLLPFRSDASEDTSSLQKAFDAASFQMSTSDVFELSDAILDARLVVFRYFWDNFPTYRNPPTWIQLQTNCASPYDPFDLVWRLVRLDHGSCMKRLQSWLGPSDLIWCFDEVQTAFENPIGEMFIDRMWFNVHNSDAKIVLSGTALRLSNVRKMTDRWAEPYSETRAQEPDWDRLLMTYSMITEHPRINEFSPFWSLYYQHFEGILTESRAIQQKHPGFQSMGRLPLRTRAGRPLGFDLDLSDMEALTLLQHVNGQLDQSRLPSHWVNLVDIRIAIQYYCPMFFGRYRWSTLFVEEILKQAVASIRNGHSLFQLSVRTAAEDAAKTATNALRAQLVRIKDKSWAQDLFWMAIRAEVYSQSSVIENETAQLVSEGFALVDRLQISSDDDAKFFIRVSLCEPLAVHAVMSYLHEEKEYDRMMNGFFSSLQVDNTDQGSIGKMAEFVLATKFDNFLQNSDDMISTNHRRNFFNIILNAPSVDRIITSNSMNQVSVDASQCNDYYLHKLDVPRPKEGGSSGQTASLDNKNIEIAEWISKVMSNEQRSNFLFPAKSEGPDLMFFLSNGPNPMILCAVQFKTSPTAHQPSKLTPGLGTLTKWLGSCPFPGVIILIYVATSTAIKVADFVDGVKSHYACDPVLVRDSSRVFVTYIDRETSASVWGGTFHYLIKLMKGLDA